MQIPMTSPSDVGARRESVLLVNAGSRRGQENFESIRQKLLEEGVNLVKANAYTNHDRLLSDAALAVRSKTPLIIVGGGDGTLGSVAGLVANSDSSMAVLPLGTGNEFARDLQIPMAIDEACDVVSKGRTIEVDLGRIQDHCFVNVATVGLTTKIAEQLTDSMKKRFGRFTYAFAIFAGLRNIRSFHAKLSTENGETEFECLQLVIGNGRLHAGPFPVLPDARLRAGKFSIYAVMGSRRSDLLKYALMLPGGHHSRLAEVHAEYATAGTLETQPRIKTTVDGEILCRTPIKFECLPSALKVIVPGDFQD